MSINSVDDVLNALIKLKEHPCLDDFVEANIDHRVVNVNAIDIDDDDLFENMEEIELSANHFFLDRNGLIDKRSEAKLKSKGFSLVRLSSDYKPFSHAIKCDEFSVMFSY